MVKIYTRTGDDGTTCLATGQRLPKNARRVEAYGEADELNSVLGVILTNPLDASVAEALVRIQSHLFDLGADLACPADEAVKLAIPRISSAHVEFLEREIDRMNESLPPLRQFILPGGDRAAAHLHLARAVCRRAERQAVTLSQSEPVNTLVIQYLNRLSDLLFIMARFQNLQSGSPETVWVSHSK
ncbi:MAG: cob(I)yrinic acid a,c-diamide adenosyltransferase [bacterium]|nr:cob(I)yrinic acid a,c-diamide adenosyltransferase [bacterium]